MLEPTLIICIVNSLGLIAGGWYFYKKTTALEQALAKSNPARRKRRP